MLQVCKSMFMKYSDNHIGCNLHDILATAFGKQCKEYQIYHIHGTFGGNFNLVILASIAIFNVHQHYS